MKFTFPAKLYLGGLIYFLFFAFLGFYTIWEMTNEDIILRVSYILVSLILIDWYYKNYIKYKNKYIIITNNNIQIIDKQEKTFINKNEISYIINANHQQLLKLHNVTHIFTKDNKYFYITNEINNYTRLKIELKKVFADHYIEIEKTIKTANTNKEYLLNLYQNNLA